jgi:hypothetical protein
MRINITNEELHFLITDSLNKILKLFNEKNNEYGKTDEAFSVFNRIAEKYKCSPYHALTMLRAKHEISIEEIADNIQSNSLVYSQEKIEEKYNDIIVYYLLEKIMISNLNFKNKI